MPRAWGSISRSSSAADPPQARDPVGAAAALELVEARQLATRAVATITLPSRRASIPRSSQ